MANEEHLNVLKKGVHAWNEWRKENPNILPDLSELNFTEKETTGLCWDDSNHTANLSRANLTKVKFQRSNLRSVIFRGADIEAADFTEADLREAQLFGVRAAGAKFPMAEAASAKFKNANLDGASLVGADFSNAIFIRASLKDTDLKANLAGANLTECDNSFLSWKVTLAGRPDIPPNYPSTPIELIIGLNPHTRRTLSDGLYLKALWESSNKVKRFGLRIWGITCGYGQSFVRWLICTVIFILIASVVATQIEMNIANHHVSLFKNGSEIISQVTSQVAKPSFDQALYNSIVTFATLGYGDITPTTPGGRIWVMIVVCIGYIMLGGLVSIFATKLGRLS